MTDHGRDTSPREEMIERALRSVTATMCAAGLPQCPMHRAMVQRYLGPILIAIAAEGWEVRRIEWKPVEEEGAPDEATKPIETLWYGRHSHPDRPIHVHSIGYEKDGDTHEGVPVFAALPDAREAETVDLSYVVPLPHA